MVVQVAGGHGSVGTTIGLSWIADKSSSASQRASQVPIEVSMSVFG